MICYLLIQSINKTVELNMQWKNNVFEPSLIGQCTNYKKTPHKQETWDAVRNGVDSEFWIEQKHRTVNGDL